MNISLYHNHFNRINSDLNDVTKEIATGKKNLSSEELNKSLSARQTITDISFINKKIEDNQLNRSTNDDTLSSIKDILSNLKQTILEYNNSNNNINQKEITLSKIDNLKEYFANISLNLKSDRLLVGQGVYKNIGLDSNDLVINNSPFFDIFDDIKNNINDNSTTLNIIDKMFDKVNLEHSKIGFQNSNINNIKDYNTQTLFETKKQLSSIEDINYIDSIMELKQLEMTYKALSHTFKVDSELSLINYL